MRHGRRLTEIVGATPGSFGLNKTGTGPEALGTRLAATMSRRKVGPLGLGAAT